MTVPLASPRFYSTLLAELVAFLRSPGSRPSLDKPFGARVADMVGLTVLKFVALVPLVAFFAVVYDPENVQSVSMAERFSPGMLLLLGGVVLPLVEEVGFRLSLVFRPVYLSLSTSVLTYYALTKAVYGTKVSMVDESFPIRVGLSVALGAVALAILHREAVAARVAAFWADHARAVFALSCVVFAWMHLAKYEVTLVNVLLLPILTLPQFFSAVIYGYLRVAMGFWYPVLLHVTMNSTLIGLSLVTS